jgi:hypothetical protein
MNNNNDLNCICMIKCRSACVAACMHAPIISKIFYISFLRSLLELHIEQVSSDVVDNSINQRASVNKSRLISLISVA